MTAPPLWNSSTSSTPPPRSSSTLPSPKTPRFLFLLILFIFYFLSFNAYIFVSINIFCLVFGKMGGNVRGMDCWSLMFVNILDFRSWLLRSVIISVCSLSKFFYFWAILYLRLLCFYHIANWNLCDGNELNWNGLAICLPLACYENWEEAIGNKILNGVFSLCWLHVMTWNFNQFQIAFSFTLATN